MLRFNWKEISLYFNFLSTGGSIEEVSQAALAYTEALTPDTPQPLTPELLEGATKTVVTNTQPV